MHENPKKRAAMRDLWHRDPWHLTWLPEIVTVSKNLKIKSNIYKKSSTLIVLYMQSGRERRWLLKWNAIAIPNHLYNVVHFIIIFIEQSRSTMLKREDISKWCQYFWRKLMIDMWQSHVHAISWLFFLSLWYLKKAGRFEERFGGTLLQPSRPRSFQMVRQRPDWWWRVGSSRNWKRRSKIVRGIGEWSERTGIFLRRRIA